MKSKKFFSVLCAAAILLSATTSTVLLNMTGITHAEEIIDEEIVSEETEPEETDPEETDPEETDPEETDPEETDPEEPAPEELTAPENLRYEDGFIKWDKVREAYGYTLRMHMSEEDYREFTKYFDYDDFDDEAQVELDRLCYENNIDFGEYVFDVRIFDEAGNTSEWTDTVIVEFAPTLAAPTNVRVSEDWEETVEWDEVEGVYRYNIRVYQDDDDRRLYTTTYTSGNLFTCSSWYESGDYLISIQAMDRDYNVSEWTEPVKVSHIAEERLKTPQNVRLDESGEKIIWDEVEGAEYYFVDIEWYYLEKNGVFYPTPIYLYSEQAQIDNWKSNVIPSPNGEYYINVYACGSNALSSDCSEQLTVSYEPVCDETIELPEDLQPENGYLQWNAINTAKLYYIFILRNGEYIENVQPEWWSIDNYRWDLDEYSNNLSYYIGNGFPEGDYEAELFVVDENGNYNSKTYSFTLDTPHDETVWVPKVFYKGSTLLWDYDRIRHDNTGYFWIRVKNAKNNTVVMLEKSWSEYFYGLPDLTNGQYYVDVCVYEYTDQLGPWSKPLDLTKHGDSLFDKENEITEEVERDPAGEGIPDEDRILSITINPAFNMKHKDGDDVELDLSKITIKANEIYDEEGLQRASEALGELIKGNKHYNLLDLTLLYDGEDFSNGYEGLVQVIIPIPAGHRDKKFSCYRLTEVDGKMVKEEIPGEQTEDSYIIYLEHFSEYAMVGAGDEEEHTHIYGEAWESDENGHWHVCECGEKSEITAHTFGEWNTTKEATETEKGEEARQCEICSYTETRDIPEKEHTHVYGESWESDENGHWHVCECGEKSEITAHTFGEWITTKAATEDEEGEETRKCEICERSETRTVEKLAPADTSDTSAPDTSDTEQSPTDTVNNNTGNFYVPENTAGTTAQTTVPSVEDVPSSQPTDNNTDAKEDLTEQISPEETSAETIQTTDNGTVDNTSDNSSDNSNSIGSVNTDKNINTGVALVAVPVAAIAAMGIIIFKKRK